MSLRVAEIRAELEQAVQKAAVVTKEWVVERLRQNVERAMQAEAVRDREGNETGEYTYQGNVANRALELLGKEIGMFVDRTEAKVIHERRSESDILAELAALGLVAGGRAAEGTEDSKGGGSLH